MMIISRVAINNTKDILPKHTNDKKLSEVYLALYFPLTDLNPVNSYAISNILDDGSL